MPSKNDIVLVPGFGSTQTLGTMAPLAAGLRTRGYSVRYVPSLRTRASFPLSLVGRYPEPVARQTQHIMQIMQAEKLEGVIGMSHSFGSLPLLAATLERPELFDQLILLCPAGLRNMPFGELALRFIAKAAQDCKRACSGEAERSLLAWQGLIGASDYFGSPYSATLALREGLAAAKSRDLVVLVARSGKKVTVLYAEDDPFFPRQKTEEALEQYPSFQKVLLKGAGHDAHLWYQILLEGLDSSEVLNCAAAPFQV